MLSWQRAGPRGFLGDDRRICFNYFVGKMQASTAASAAITTTNWVHTVLLRCGGGEMKTVDTKAADNFNTSPAASTVTDLIGSAAQTEAEQLLQHYKDFAANGVSTALPILWTTNDDLSRYIRDKIDTVLFDCDGVLYRTQDTCPGATECIRSLIVDQKKNVFFVTNNSATNRRQLKDKLSKLLQLDDSVLRIEQMVSSAYCCARYLQQQFAMQDERQQEQRQQQEQGKQDKDAKTSKTRVRRVHVIGSTGLCEELLSAGFEITGGDSIIDGVDVTSAAWGTMTREDLEVYPFDEHPIDALVVGHDVSMNFRKLTIALNLLLRNPDAIWVASNEDSFDLVGSDGRHIPGNGATVKALEYCSNKKAVNVGKPSMTLTEILRQDHPEVFGNSSDMERCLFVGDRLDTDIQFAINNNMKSILVMTGVTTAQTMKDFLVSTGRLDDGSASDYSAERHQQPLPTFIIPYVGMMV